MRNKISLILILMIAGCAASAAPRQEYKRDFQKSVPMPGGRVFHIESQFGHIGIRAQSRSDVAIQATIHCSANTLDEARRCGDQIQISVDEKAGGVFVSTSYPRNIDGKNLSFAVDYDIAMPDTAPLDLRNRFGSTEVSDLHASATINSGNGSVTFLNGRGTQLIENTFGMVEVRKNEGDVTISNSGSPTIAADVTGAVEITNRFGEVRVTNAGRSVVIHSNNSNVAVSNAAGPANISNTFGNVNVSDVRSDVTVQNQNGEITVNGIAGKADLHNSFAAIKFSRIGKALKVHATNSMVRGETVGESATIETSFGMVDVHGIQGKARIETGNSPIRVSGVGGELYARTTFAEIAIGNVRGPLTVEAQNASVAVDAKTAQHCQPISIRTSFGPIRVTIPKGAGYNLTAHTTFGNVHSDPPVLVSGNVSGDGGRAELTGKIGGGGCELRLMDQNGSIDILH